MNSRTSASNPEADLFSAESPLSLHVCARFSVGTDNFRSWDAS
jgi:hypothetical protein